MTRPTMLVAAAVLLMLAVLAANLLSGRGTPEPSESAPAALPVPGAEPPPPTTSPETPPGRTLAPDTAPGAR